MCERAALRVLRVLQTNAPKKATQTNSPWMSGLSPGPLTTVNDQWRMSSCTTGSLKWRPMRRLASKTVLRGFIATWFLAASPVGRFVLRENESIGVLVVSD